ncbi:hypothetical protein FH608_046560 [Nonomuraea phyllanthi]|uniref:Uncharacterized protein n=1 Tax=Nonomuraea phyllanthi TaxID=2219224 RepID=A0A5C4V685_9ACTN|nr:hypothetical protein [Nonomuraea phyllanthi]KAB8186956.1 hypothetical protein FH608_046560 [Nonomuraea phyllanthi]
MPEQKFIIRALLEYEYLVTAENADEAERLMEDGEQIGEGSCVGYSVDAVVAADKRGRFWCEEDDLRARCECGHLVVNEHTGRKFGEREPSKTFTQQCSAYGCNCPTPVEVKTGDAA